MTALTPERGWLPVGRDESSAAFFDGAARGVLMLRRCRSCAEVLAPEAMTCAACGEADLEWTGAAGTGTLVSWTIVHRPPTPAFAGATPYLLALVELAEGPWLHARLDTGEADGLHPGLPLQVAFVRPPESEPYPVFTIASC